MAFYLIRKATGWALLFIATAFATAKRLAEWVGLTTAPEDAADFRGKV